MSDLTEIKQRMRKWIAKQATALHPYMPFGAVKTSDLTALLAEDDRLTRERDALLATVNNDLQMKTEVALRFELEQLQAELAEARAERDALRLAIDKHRRTVWGDLSVRYSDAVRHPADTTLYAALAQIEQEKANGNG